MVYYNNGEIRYDVFRDNLDPGWKARWDNSNLILKFNNMDELDKHFYPYKLTTSNTCKLAGELAKTNIEQDCRETNNNVSAISRMEELGLLNVDKCEDYLNKL